MSEPPGISARVNERTSSPLPSHERHAEPLDHAAKMHPATTTGDAAIPPWLDTSSTTAPVSGSTLTSPPEWAIRTSAPRDVSLDAVCSRGVEPWSITSERSTTRPSMSMREPATSKTAHRPATDVTCTAPPTGDSALVCVSSTTEDAEASIRRIRPVTAENANRMPLSSTLTTVSASKVNAGAAPASKLSNSRNGKIHSSPVPAAKTTTFSPARNTCGELGGSGTLSTISDVAASMSPRVAALRSRTRTVTPF